MSTSDTVKYVLDERELPTHDQPDGRPPTGRTAASAPGTKQPAGPDDLSALFPMGLIQQEVSTRAVRRDPRSGARRLPPVASDAALPAPGAWSASSTRPRTSTSSTRASRPPARTSRTPPCPQAYENAKAGIRKLTTETGAGQWGSLAGLRLQRCSASSARSSWSALLRPEAVSPLDDADLGREVHRSPSTLTEAGRAQQPSTRPARSGSRSPRRSRSRRRARTPTTRSARCSTTCCCTRP